MVTTQTQTQAALLAAQLQVAQLQAAIAQQQAALAKRRARKHGNACIMAKAHNGTMVGHYYASKAAHCAPQTTTKQAAPVLGAAVAQPTLGATSVGTYSITNIVAKMQPGVVYSTPQVHGLFSPVGMAMGGRNPSGTWPGGNTLPQRLRMAAAQGLLQHSKQGNTNYWQRVA